jgi:thioredoxin reductase (NADPH)
LQTPDGEIRIKNDFVFALTGITFGPDFLRAMGIELSSEQCRPGGQLPGSNAGVYVAGNRCRIADQRFFIENGRFHGQPDRDTPK